jgi:multisubunit Na+/H+ antiporter MnhC subunit
MFERRVWRCVALVSVAVGTDLTSVSGLDKVSVPRFVKNVYKVADQASSVAQALGVTALVVVLTSMAAAVAPDAMVRVCRPL